MMPRCSTLKEHCIVRNHTYPLRFFFLQEYDAYKRHMSTLLGKEKELNNKLRILIG